MMAVDRSDMIAQLRKEILPLQGYKPVAHPALDNGLGLINRSFPEGKFPYAAIHEFQCRDESDAAATNGFIGGLLSAPMKQGGAMAWIGTSLNVFPPALLQFGIDPSKVLFIQTRRERDMPWVMEEALRCGGLTAVIGEIRELSFTASRRLQLAMESSQVTGCIIRKEPFRSHTTASLARWCISPLPTSPVYGLPGPGFPKWKVQLQKVRNGKPGTWELEWNGDCFVQIPSLHFIPFTKKKTG